MGAQIKSGDTMTARQLKTHRQKLLDIQARMLGYKTAPLTHSERTTRLKSLETTEMMLVQYRKKQRELLRKLWDDMAESEIWLDDVRNQLKQLRNDGGIIVTEHALLRFIERYMNVDINEAYAGVLKLGASDTVKRGNTVITVCPPGLGG